jgi:hypothetical protein
VGKLTLRSVSRVQSGRLRPPTDNATLGPGGTE